MSGSPSTPPPARAALVDHFVRSNRRGIVANVVGAAIYAWLLWPIGSRPALAGWLAVMAAVSLTSGVVLELLARRSHDATWWHLAPTVGFIGSLWGATPIVCHVRDLSTPRGSMVVVLAACVAANGVVTFAAFPQLFLVFAGPILALTSVTYLTSSTELGAQVALGSVVLFVVFVAYNRQVHAYLAASLYAHELLREQAARHQYDATHDLLTGLLNRAGFLEALAESPVSIAFFDLDGFKQINDLYGHAAGDRILQVVGERLAARVRGGDLCARLGGDEFVVALRDRGGIPGPPATRLAAAIAEPITFGDELLTVTSSVGIAEPDGPADTIDAILRRADRAMYDMKHQRRTVPRAATTVTPAPPWW